MRVQFLVVYLISFSLVQQQVLGNLNSKGFIRAQGTKFVDANCEEYVFNGWNSWMMIETAIGRMQFTDQSHFEGKAPLEWMMDTAVAANMNTFRIFGHGHDKDIMTLQTSPGNYDQNALYGIDKVLDLASRRNLRVVLTFADNWKHVDSKWNYVWWSNTAKWADDFYTDANAKSMFKDHMNFMVNRVNSVNGRTYCEDPTILAWNLINEPRSEHYNCDTQCQQNLQNWMDEMSTYLKSIDPNHMITIGEEGFYGWNSGKEHFNPDAWSGKSHTWSMKSGQNFVPNHMGAAIDFAAIHIWVDNWGINYDGLKFFTQWIDEHANDARQINKPLVIEEFGKISWNEANFPWERNPYFQIAYQKLADSVQYNDVIQGSMWWEWESDENSAWEQYDVKTYQSTWKDHIQPQSKKIQELINLKPVVQNCIPGDWMSFEILNVGQRNSYDFVYYIFRPNLVASFEGEPMKGPDGQLKVTGVSVDDCALRCENSVPQCVSFTFNAQSGECQVMKQSSQPEGGFQWSEDGTATYWRQVGSNGNCADSNCQACSQDGACIKCAFGFVLFRDADFFAKPYCRSCGEFPEEVQSQSNECSSPSQQ